MGDGAIPNWPLPLARPPRVLVLACVRQTTGGERRQMRWRQPDGQWGLALMHGRGSIADPDGRWHRDLRPGSVCATPPGTVIDLAFEPNCMQWEVRFAPVGRAGVVGLPAVVDPSPESPAFAARCVRPSPSRPATRCAPPPRCGTCCTKWRRSDGGPTLLPARWPSSTPRSPRIPPGSLASPGWRRRLGARRSAWDASSANTSACRPGSTWPCSARRASATCWSAPPCRSPKSLRWWAARPPALQ